MKRMMHLNENEIVFVQKLKVAIAIENWYGDDRKKDIEYDDKHRKRTIERENGSDVSL